jgi:surface antigen
MRTRVGTSVFYASFITATLIAATSSANANTHHSHHARAHGHAGHHHSVRHASYRHQAMVGARVIQCVAFAKEDAGIEIRGNARDWWNRAAGIYERGEIPEPGSVLSFRETGRMPLGHVAVVSATLDSRTIVIDQSHWNSRGITRDVEVEDVSEDNDWSLVRVQLKRGGAFGSIYPTHGFIYPRPASNRDAREAETRPVSAAFAPSTLEHHHSTLEVAEMPSSSRGLDLSVNGFATDAPYRALR